MSESLKAVILGAVEGLTEFIPVSSTGHLILTGKLIGFDGENAATFEIFIQLGAILAVVVLYLNRFRSLLDFSRSSDDSEYGFSGRQGIGKLFVACLPAFVLGPLLHGHIKTYLFSPLTVSLALIVGGVVMILIERRELETQVLTLENLSYATCFNIGLFQCFALWPGVSRSGATIIGGMLLGLHRQLAAEFSFLVAVPVMIAAVSYDLMKSFGALGGEDIKVFAIGFVVSFVTAILAIKFFLGLLRTHTLIPFGVYRIGIGLLVLLLLWN